MKINLIHQDILGYKIIYTPETRSILSKNPKTNQSFKSIPDYRVDVGKIEYSLYEVLFIILFALQKSY